MLRVVSKWIAILSQGQCMAPIIWGSMDMTHRSSPLSTHLPKRGRSNA